MKSPSGGSTNPVLPTEAADEFPAHFKARIETLHVLERGHNDVSMGFEGLRVSIGLQ